MIERYLCKHVQRRALLFYRVRLSLYTPGIWSTDQITGVYIYITRESLLLAKLFTNAKQEEDSPGKGFLWGILFKKTGLGIFGGYILKNRYIQYYYFSILHYLIFFDMRKYLVRGPNNGSICIQREKLCSSMSARGRYSRKRVSLGILFLKNGAWHFLGYILKKTDISNIITFQFCIT